VRLHLKQFKLEKLVQSAGKSLILLFLLGLLKTSDTSRSIKPNISLCEYQVETKSSAF